ncbi:hypothetical protein [Kingella oralis]|uniref:hypothetical protein n=1 Tax=Kingella oralis TaxID=505 RepID=UPI0015F493FA|nr:hypothetical protein [Kingella oralis]QMT42915.1 hypothetical protein H3L93_00620 [Kingella oralis]
MDTLLSVCLLLALLLLPVSGALRLPELPPPPLLHAAKQSATKVSEPSCFKDIIVSFLR